MRLQHSQVACRRGAGWLLLATCAAGIALADGNIDSTDKYAWSENAGWHNWNDPNGGGVAVNVSGGYLSGYVWAENVGWIKLGADAGGPYLNTAADNYGVNMSGGGELSGYAWSETCGWNDDVPRIYRDSGFAIMNLDWDSYLISTRPEVAAVERSRDKTLKDGSHMPWYDVDPDTPTLHFPIKVIDGLTGIFRSDRVSAQTLYYLMSSSPVPVDESQKINVTLESLLKTVDHWSGRKKQGSLICYAEDAEYVGTTGYFFLKRYGKSRVFDDNPGVARLLSDYIDALLERGDLGHVAEAVAEGPILEDKSFHIEKDMAWHRANAVAWAKTPSALACDPYCRLISDRLQKMAGMPRSEEEELLYRKAWFHLICAENSDGRWPPFPKKPGNFNVHYIWDQLVKARQTLALLGAADFNDIPSTEVNPET